MLDIIGSALSARGVPFLRIDGTVASAAERQVRRRRAPSWKAHDFTCASTPPAATCSYELGLA